MQKNNMAELLKRQLWEELEQYEQSASNEEWDWKAVEAMLYLLDKYDPLEEGVVPSTEASWERFLKVAGRRELLPVGDGEPAPAQIRID